MTSPALTMVHDGDVGGVIEASRVLAQVIAGDQHLFDDFLADLGQQHLTLLFVQVEVGLVLDQVLHQEVDDPVQIAAVLGRA